jgi:hypothetical protein
MFVVSRARGPLFGEEYGPAADDQLKEFSSPVVRAVATRPLLLRCEVRSWSRGDVGCDVERLLDRQVGRALGHVGEDK